VVRKADGALVRALGEADISRLQAVGWIPPQEHVVKAADGVTDLWVTLYLPYNFDPSRQYPVVEYIYAGPQTIRRPLDFADQSAVPYAPRYDQFNRALANLGFVVLVLDARGTPGRSQAFQDVVYRNWGQFEIDDHATAIRQLGARLKFMDLTRVGVWGASWGGHFAFRALTQASDLYKAGICRVPAFNPRRIMLHETYLGMPRENKAGYDAADAFALAPRLKGELLLIGAMNDAGTQADLLQMSEILIRRGKQHRTLSYPYAGHGPTNQINEYDMELKKRFFIEHLMRQGAP
jgi:dipeptidyl aminopeptidase/acylaminoacyl peptidase